MKHFFLLAQAPAEPSATESNRSGANGAGNAGESFLGQVPSSTDEITRSVLSTVIELWEGFLAHLPLLGLGAGILVLTGLVGAMSNRVSSIFLKPWRVRNSLKELIRRFIYIGIWIAGLMVAAMVVFPGVTPARALATLGLGSIAIGFAFKDIFENFFAGILLLWKFPFENGDFIECSGILGRVEDITIRNTLIRKTTGELVVVPNATLFKNPVDVLTDLDRRRVTVICSVAYGEDVDQSREVITKAVQQCETVRQQQPLQIFAQEFADSGINFEVTWWTGPTPVDIRRSRDEVVAAVKRALNEAGIEIPFPYRTLTFKETPLPISATTSPPAAED